MCWKEKCCSCNKYTWGGCGDHIQCILASIPLQDRCLCLNSKRIVVTDTICTTIDDDLLLLRMDNLLSYISLIISNKITTNIDNEICVNISHKQNIKHVCNDIKSESESADIVKVELSNAQPSENDVWMNCRQLQMRKLKANQLQFYYASVIDTNVQRPVGHSTHNLFLYSKLSKKQREFYLVTHRQPLSDNERCDLKQLCAQLKCKPFRLAIDYVGKYFHFEKGCITALSLLNMESGGINGNKLRWILDEQLLNEETLSICAGCVNPLDHTQHHIIDISPKLLLKLVGDMGIRPTICNIALETKK